MSCWHDESEPRAVLRVLSFVAGMIVIAAALSGLLGCVHAPARVIATPDVCPSLPAVPEQARTVLPETLPELDASVTDADSASELLRVRVDSAAMYQACRANNSALQKWVLSHTKE